VIEEFAGGREAVEPERAFERAAEQEIEDHGRERGIG
jgi:hypothetical protein